MIRHLAPVKRRYAAHCVDYVLVETWEESKPVLAGHPMLDRTPSAIGELMSAGVLALVDDRNAAGLASRNIAALEHYDIKAALDQLVRGTHAGDTAAQDDNPSRHASPSHDHLARLLANFGGVTERAGRDTSDHSRRSHEHFQA
jgi:hypothetical protein